MSGHAVHEQVIEVKVRDPAAFRYHRVRVVIDLADIARRYGQRSVFVPSGRCRLLEGAVIVEHLVQVGSPEGDR